MKALVICGKSPGDVVFSTPVIRAMKVELDDIHLHGLFPAEVAYLAKENPYLDTIHIQEGSFWKLLRNLRQEKFDVVVNLRQDWLSKWLSFLLFKRTYSSPSTRWKQWLMVNLKINHLPNVHHVDKLILALKPLRIKGDELGLDFFIPEKDKVVMEWLPAEFRRGFVVFCISAPYSTRKLPVDRMIELCDKINKPVIILGSAEDVATGEVINTFFARGLSVVWQQGLLELNKKTIVYNACGKFNFNQMASLIKQSWAVFTFDNDFVPIASAFRKEVFALWGNTILLFGKYPYRTKFTVLESNSVACRPCSANGFEKCPKGHFKCMRDIMFDFYFP
ncbi:MAG TPA: glycosyltransferase family 9 protein [Chryseolinea sp.]|nr:glycosyltransferase family 9 protein [Chryseolinea sp.]